MDKKTAETLTYEVKLDGKTVAAFLHCDDANTFFEIMEERHDDCDWEITGI